MTIFQEKKLKKIIKFLKKKLNADQPLYGTGSLTRTHFVGQAMRDGLSHFAIPNNHTYYIYIWTFHINYFIDNINLFIKIYTSEHQFCIYI